MKPIRVLFVGASNFGLACLEALFASEEIKIVGILTAPRDFKISYSETGVRNYLHSDIAHQYARSDVPVYVMHGRMNDPALLRFIDEQKPDAIVVAGWYHMVPRSIYECYKVAGLHASLLPRYSGHAPLVWSILNNEAEAGISLFRIAQGVDSGEIIGSRATEILFSDTIASLYGRIQRLAIELLQNDLLPWVRNEVPGRAQDDAQRTVMPPRTPADGELDWRANALQIYNAVRAQSHPYPGAFTYLGRTRIGIETAHIDFQRRAEPHRACGTVVAIDDDGMLVSCLPGEYLLKVATVRTADEAIVPAAAWARSVDVRPGQMFGRGRN
ncbi:hypothetical protein CAL18_17640 [Bordetella genomosp. 7]|uniref:methionyl-tRNA formyltransferase n=1 Tax=Bordetella genomosp. 7 TaxID=1416805 RepID=UPI000B9E9A16|nr:methionyl-tRNA formyltransferase [Bordetella genomosp. 7]OZI15797.1 hypothetical protein CAL18_17640 [Bordetella genomosp. 7]